jgi:hypothetical protein
MLSSGIDYRAFNFLKIRGRRRSIIPCLDKDKFHFAAEIKKRLHLRTYDKPSTVSIWLWGHRLTVNMNTWWTFDPKCLFCHDISDNQFSKELWRHKHLTIVRSFLEQNQSLCPSCQAT